MYLYQPLSSYKDVTSIKIVWIIYWHIDWYFVIFQFRMSQKYSFLIPHNRWYLNFNFLFYTQCICIFSLQLFLQAFAKLICSFHRYSSNLHSDQTLSCLIVRMCLIPVIFLFGVFSFLFFTPCSSFVSDKSIIESAKVSPLSPWLTDHGNVRPPVYAF